MVTAILAVVAMILAIMSFIPTFDSAPMLKIAVLLLSIGLALPLILK